MELMSIELLIFKRYQVDVEDIKCLFQWWDNMKQCFRFVGFLAWQVLSIVKSQIETKRIFLLVGIFTNLRRCKLQTENLEKLIFINKKIVKRPQNRGCKSPFNLVKFIEMDGNLKKQFEQFEGDFERDEVSEL